MHNPAFNDVVCEPFPTTGVITTGDENDRVFLGGSNSACASAPGTPFEIDLGSGTTF